VVSDYCVANPDQATQTAFETFFFCETVEEEVALPLQAWTLEEFRDCISHLPHASLQFHFITSRLRLQLGTNDFSYWLAKDLGQKELARRLDQIDVYTNTLDSARTQIVELVERELHR
jgi:hypothetical protein